MGYFKLWTAPPIPLRVVTEAGAVLFTGQDIREGQNLWQSMGGQEVDTIWGHAPTSPRTAPGSRRPGGGGADRAVWSAAPVFERHREHP